MRGQDSSGSRLLAYIRTLEREGYGSPPDMPPPTPPSKKDGGKTRKRKYYRVASGSGVKGRRQTFKSRSRDVSGASTDYRSASGVTKSKAPRNSKGTKGSGTKGGMFSSVISMMPISENAWVITNTTLEYLQDKILGII